MNTTKKVKNAIIEAAKKRDVRQVPFSVRISEDVLEAFKYECKRNRVSMTAVIEEFMKSVTNK